MIIIFIFIHAKPETQDYYHDFTDQLSQKISPACLYNKKLSCLFLIHLFKKNKHWNLDIIGY